MSENMQFDEPLQRCMVHETARDHECRDRLARRLEGFTGKTQDGDLEGLENRSLVRKDSNKIFHFLLGHNMSLAEKFDDNDDAETEVL